MAALLGLALGGMAGLGVAEEHKKRAANQKSADLLLQTGFQSGDPTVFDNPDFQKIIAGAYGKDFAKNLPAMAKAFNKPITGAPTMPGAAAPQAGSPSPMGMAMGGSAPASSGATTVPPTATAPVGGELPTGAPSGGVRPAPEHGDPNDPKTWMTYADSMQQFADQNPNNQRVQQFAQTHIAQARERATFLQKQQDYQQTQARLTQTEQDRKADREQMQAFREQQASINNDFKAQTLQERKDRDAATAQQHNETAFNNHLTQLNNKKLSLIQGLQQKLQAGSLDEKTAKPVVDAYNKTVDRLSKAADDIGMDFNAEDYYVHLDPGKKGYFMGIGGTKPTVEEGGDTATAAASATPTFKAGDRRTKDGVIYERDAKGNWNPVKS